ncbi:MAG: hypothetical protein AB7V14_02505 [Kiritimatiellia bacterium]
MVDINFNCPHCGQNLNGPEDMAGQTIECPVCQKEFQIPGGIIEVPKTQLAPPSRAPASPPSGGSPTDTAAIPRNSSNDDKGKTVRIELPPEFLAEPDKHIFKIKRIQR